MFVVLYIARWIFGAIVAFKLILGCHVHLLALLILCWDTLQVIRWRCDVLSMAMRITYDFSGVSDDDQRRHGKRKTMNHLPSGMSRLPDPDKASSYSTSHLQPRRKGMGKPRDEVDNFELTTCL
jgi:hypothetical protein